jgi:hypothetical protein
MNGSEQARMFEIFRLLGEATASQLSELTGLKSYTIGSTLERKMPSVKNLATSFHVEKIRKIVMRTTNGGTNEVWLWKYVAHETKGKE